MTLINASNVKGETNGTYTKVTVARQSIHKSDGNMTIGRIQTIHEGTIDETKSFWENSPWQGAFDYEEASKFEFDRFHQIKKEEEFKTAKHMIHIIETECTYSGKSVSKETINNYCLMIGEDSFNPDEHMQILVDYSKLTFVHLIGINTIENKLRYKQEFVDKYFKEEPLMQEWAKHERFN